MMLTAEFSTRNARVRQEGRTTVAPVEWVEISGAATGDVVSRRARPADRVRFKEAYAKFAPPPEKVPAPSPMPAAARKKG